MGEQLENYIKINSIYKKIKLAENNKKTLYISAPMGAGKTSAVSYYFRNKKVLWITAKSGKLSRMPDLQIISEDTIVVDDLCWISDQESKNYISNIVSSENKCIILIARSKMPSWLNQNFINCEFILAVESDFLFDETNLEKLLQSKKIELENCDIQKIIYDTKGYALALLFAVNEVFFSKQYTDIEHKAWIIDLYEYFNNNLFNKWSKDIQNLLITVSNFKYFTLELAEYITNNKNVIECMHSIKKHGEFLFLNPNGQYEMQEYMYKYFEWKYINENLQDYQNDCYAKAAHYFEINNNENEALFYYEKVGNISKLLEILKANAYNHVGTGYYYQMRKYYFRLPEKEILKVPVFMSAMSMLYSLMMQVEKSEIWYSRLESFSNNSSNDINERKEAKIRLKFLDLSLAHRGSAKVITLIRNMAAIMTNKNISFPEFSVTSNLPSILNGGLDFCDWTKNDKEIARTMRKPIEMVLGKWGIGLVDIALSESYFEKHYDDYYDITEHLNSGYTKAELGGKLEVCFVAIAVLSRINIVKNKSQLAKKAMLEFKNKVIKQKAYRLLPNIQAFINSIDIFEGNLEAVKLWLDSEAPNENEEFYVLDRYRYLVKVRSYLALGMNEEALNLIQRLSLYFSKYKRTYMSIENELLKSIAEYRLQIGDWKKTLFAVFPKIEEYHFLYVIGREGIAIRQLLKELKDVPISEKFQHEVNTIINDMSINYPKYLKCIKIDKKLTNTEQRIMHLYCQGLDQEEICDLCDISYNTLKFHNRNIYKKLNVNSRAQAEKRVKELHILEYK